MVYKIVVLVLSLFLVSCASNSTECDVCPLIKEKISFWNLDADVFISDTKSGSEMIVDFKSNNYYRDKYSNEILATSLMFIYRPYFEKLGRSEIVLRFPEGDHNLRFQVDEFILQEVNSLFIKNDYLGNIEFCLSNLDSKEIYLMSYLLKELSGNDNFWDYLYSYSIYGTNCLDGDSKQVSYFILLISSLDFLSKQNDTSGEGVNFHDLFENMKVLLGKYNIDDEFLKLKFKEIEIKLDSICVEG